jgi:predicted nucleic acid-binding protein
MGLMETLRRRRTYLDTNVFIYSLEGYRDFLELSRTLFLAIDTGQLETVTSQLSLTELLVKAFKTADKELETKCRRTIQNRPGLRVEPIGEEILVEAARLRAQRQLRLPDALHLATAAFSGCEAFLTNDRRLKGISPLEVIVLKDCIPA